MIELHVSHDLYKKFQLDERGFLKQRVAQDETLSSLSSVNALSKWHAKVINIQRRNCVILLHEQTQFPVFMLCLTKPHFVEFRREFECAVADTLAAANASKAQLNVAQTLRQPLCVDANTHQDAQNSLDLLIHFLRTEIFVGRLDITKIDAPSMAAALAVLPSFARGLQQPFMPKMAMLELLSANINAAQAIAKGCAVVH